MRTIEKIILAIIAISFICLGVISGKHKKEVLKNFDFQKLEHRKIESIQVNNIQRHRGGRGRSYTSFSVFVRFQSGSSMTLNNVTKLNFLNNSLDLMAKEDVKNYYAVLAKVNDKKCLYEKFSKSPEALKNEFKEDYKNDNLTLRFCISN